MNGTGLFSRVAVRYEVALDVLGAHIAHHSEQIAIERDKPEPDERVIAAAELAKNGLRDLREELDPKDAKRIESVIADLAPAARALYANTYVASH